MNKLLKQFTGKRIRATLKQSLSISGAFYILDRSYSLNSLLNFRALNFRSINIIEFLIVYAIIIFLFYHVLDFILRYIFLKKMKKNILATVREEKRLKKIEALRHLSAYKTRAIDFIFDYPVDLGYLKPAEIGPVEELKVSDKEKEDAIVEMVSQFNRWICTIAHLLITLIFVYNWYPVLMSFFFVFGIMLIFILVPGMMIFIENIEVLPLILKAMEKRSKSLSYK